jgi:preprotein translocase subunit YajC
MPAQQAPGQFGMLVLLVLLFGLMWWSSRKARRQREEAERMREGLTPGMRVMTGSGLFGTVLRIEGDRVFLDVGSGQVTEWLLQAIAEVDEPALDNPAFDAAGFDEAGFDDSAFDDPAFDHSAFNEAAFDKSASAFDDLDDLDISALDDLDDARARDDLTEPDDSAR